MRLAATPCITDHCSGCHRVRSSIAGHVLFSINLDENRHFRLSHSATSYLLLPFLKQYPPRIAHRTFLTFLDGKADYQGGSFRYPKPISDFLQFLYELGVSYSPFTMFLNQVIGITKGMLILRHDTGFEFFHFFVRQLNP